MIKQIFKIIWKQRKTNGWIFSELLVVICAMWFMADRFYVDLVTYYSPLGYDITDTWRFKLSTLSPQAEGYIPEEEYNSSDTEDLLRLMEQIRLHPQVEDVCAAFNSTPYSFGNSWSTIYSVDGDTTRAANESFQVRRVTPEFFNVFRIRDKDGKPITPEMIAEADKPVIITEDMEKAFFHEQSGTGREVNFDNEEVDKRFTIMNVSVPIRGEDYSKANPSVFYIMQGRQLNEFVGYFGASSAELCVRMKKTFTQDEMYGIMAEMGNRLTVNNLTVHGVTPTSYYRESQISGKRDGNTRQYALTTFLLINVFFGIIGTFWLRTQSRRGEIGIRIALGSTRSGLKTFIYGEGLCLLLLTLPLVLLFVVNIFYFDVPDTFRLAVGFTRLLVTVGGTYALLAVMICIGIWFPVRKAAGIPPAEALHYE